MIDKKAKIVTFLSFSGVESVVDIKKKKKI